jgi:hypothetical protein
VTAKLVLATTATALVLISAVLPMLAGAFALVATNGRLNALVILCWIAVAALWWAVLWLLLRTLEMLVWESKVYAWRAAIGAITGFVVGFLARDAFFTTGRDSDYPAAAYALLYAVTFVGAIIPIAGVSEAQVDASRLKGRAA